MALVRTVGGPDSQPIAFVQYPRYVGVTPKPHWLVEIRWIPQTIVFRFFPRRFSAKHDRILKMANQLKSLQKIFTDRLFRIPDYQRGFSWGPVQLKDFWHDLTHIPSRRKHYTGVLTLEPVSAKISDSWHEDKWLIEKAGFQPYYVVDGQQRLTTAVILIQCILNRKPSGSELNFVTREDIEARYIVRTSGINQSYIFGYEKDNPSYEFLKTRIFGATSVSDQGTETVYTGNLDAAKLFFERQLATLPDSELEKLFARITQDLFFNEYEITDDLDVFVAFETMNNRGKPLSKLELLKNRLIYLSTLVQEPEPERVTLRSNVNDAWKTIYEQLGKQKGYPLDDDDFLRNHWIVYLGYSRKKAHQFAHVLLNEIFTATRASEAALTAQAIKEYVVSVQEASRQWHRLNFPEHNASLADKVVIWLERLSRLGYGAFRPLILAALLAKADPDSFVALLAEAERFVFLVSRAAKRRADVGDNDFYRLAFDCYHSKISIGAVTERIKTQTDRLFVPDRFRLTITDLFKDRDGYYSWNGLQYFLFEYEQRLREKATSNTAKLSWSEFTRSKKDHVTVEHIYPRDGSRDCWRKEFERFAKGHQHRLCNSLGNLVALAHV